ncbi:MAG: hypothetical protein AB8G15_01745 [Saprospiraceae bacterium]
MNTENFTYYLKNPAALYQITYQEMKSMVKQYPYCQNLRFLLVKKSQIENHKNFDKDLNTAATFSPDRSFFFKQIKKNVLSDPGEDSFRLQEDYLELLDLSSEITLPLNEMTAPEDQVHLENKFNLIEEVVPPATEIPITTQNKSLAEQLNEEEGTDFETEEQKAIFLEDLVKDQKLSLEQKPNERSPVPIPPEELVEKIVQVEEEKPSTDPVIEPPSSATSTGNLAPEDFYPVVPVKEVTEQHTSEEEVLEEVSAVSEDLDLPPVAPIEENQVADLLEDVMEDSVEEIAPSSSTEHPEDNNLETTDTLKEGSVLEFLVQHNKQQELVPEEESLVVEKTVEVSQEKEEKEEIGASGEKFDSEMPKQIDEIIESLEVTNPLIDLTNEELPAEAVPSETPPTEIAPEMDAAPPSNDDIDIPFETVPANLLAPSPKDSFESWMKKYHESSNEDKKKKKKKIKKKDKAKRKKKKKEHQPKKLKAKAKKEEKTAPENTTESKSESKSEKKVEPLRIKRQKRIPRLNLDPKKKEEQAPEGDKNKKNKSTKAVKPKKLSVTLKEAKKLTAAINLVDQSDKQKKKKKKKKKKDKYKDLPKNIFENKDIASETLAEILVKQESYDQAILVYKRLSLIFPEKSAYFAKKIDALDILKQQ